jgi:hypothetical protein
MTIAILETSRRSDPDRRRRIIAVTVLAGAFALSSNRIVYDAFYVNSHGLVMSAFLLLVLGAYRARSDRGWLITAAVAAAVIVPARPEGVLVVFLGVLPVLTDPELDRRDRLTLGVPIAAITGIWFGAGLWAARGAFTADPRDTVLGGLLVGGVILALAALPLGRLETHRQRIPAMVLIAMTAFLVLESIATPAIMRDALAATAQNMFGRGLWGVTWPVLIVASVIAYSTSRFLNDRVFTIPMAGYAVLFFMLAYLREGTYRVGEGDSGNRVLAHVVLVAITYVALAAGQESEVESREPEVGSRSSEVDSRKSFWSLVARAESEIGTG